MWTPPADEVVQGNGGWTPPADERVDQPTPASEKSVGGLLSNAVSDVGGMASGVLQGVMHPIDTVKNVATHLPEIGHGMLHSWGLDSQDSGHRMQTLKDEAYEHPVSHLLDAASVAFPAAKAVGIGDKALEGANIAGKAGEMADSLDHTADIMRAKDLGARTRAFGELGEDEAARIGRRAKEMGVEGSTRTQLDKAKAIDAEQGQRVGDFRKIGDMTGAAPDFPGLLEQIEKELGPKYRTGVESGSSGQLDNALEDVRKLAPKVSPTKQVPAMEQVRPGAGPMNLTDDARLASEPTIGTKDVRGVQQVTPPDGQMDLLGGTFRPDLFPQESHSSALVPSMKTVPVAGQSAVPSLAGQQELLPSDPFTSMLKQTTKEVPNPAFDAAQPTTSDLANKATGLNQFARNEKSLMRPSGATSDVANIVSRENDQALAQTLGSDSAKDYLDTLSKESDAKTMAQMLGEKRARELGGSHSPGSLTSKVVHFAQDRFGYSLSAKALDKLANVVRQSPQMLGKYGPALANLGPAALATTAHLLAQNDPNFGATLEKAGIGQ